MFNSGLDAELKAKEDAKYNPHEEEMVCRWIHDVTGDSKKGDLLDWLKDGTVLIRLANKLTGKSIKANESTMPFKQMENIANFLKSCRDDLKMRENDLFTTADLFDGKSRVNVINGLIATSRAASKAGFRGPTIAPKESAGGDTKHWDIGKADAGISRMSMGSAGIMERLPVDTSKNITFGADSSGTGSSEVSKLSMGSAGVMERLPVSNAKDIDFGAKASKS
jgi:hypothetical protein